MLISWELKSRVACTRVRFIKKNLPNQPARSHSTAVWYTNSKNSFCFKIGPKINMREPLKVLASQPQRPKIKVIESKKIINKKGAYMHQMS